LEKQFLEIPGPLDAPQRQELWPHMAVLNKALDRPTDAAVCWVNALWEETDLAPRWARAWASGESLGGGEVKGDDLDRLLVKADPADADLRGLASCLVWSAYQEQPPPELARRLGRVAQFLEAHEKLLPVRGAWLAWVSLVRLSRGDVLAL